MRAFAEELVVLCAGLVADGRGHLPHQRYRRSRPGRLPAETPWPALPVRRRASLVPPVVGGYPSRSIAGAAFCICAAFSSSVICATSAAARCSKLAETSSQAAATRMHAYRHRSVRTGAIPLRQVRRRALENRQPHLLLPLRSSRAKGPSSAPTKPPARSVLRTVPSTSPAAVASPAHRQSNENA